ncbi:COX15/CtaA family protein [Halomonas halodenitrificans]|uniref:COX15/CtaA family protein n=1 Tax=Halomonas halodenitrificans TaxID=28252 RepID=UPI00048877DD|nr:COX15/CtaA family protein [Halomonas halodenitrificans]
MQAAQRRLTLLKGLGLAGVVFTMGVILLGAWTRLVDAGLGCPDWPGCYGALVVPDEGRALAHSPASPLVSAKAWMEMVHRYVASALGLLVIALVLLGWPLRRRADYPWRLSLALLGLIMLQGAFGAFTVTLKLWPQVVTLHLLGGFSVMLVFLWLHLRLRRCANGHLAPGGVASPRCRLTPLWGIAAMLLVAQLALGGWVSSNYAGIACQGFPTCNGAWWPAMDWSEGFHLSQGVGPNYLHGQLHAEARSAIQVGHRLGALALGMALMALVLHAWREPAMRPWLAGLGSAYIVQFLLGIANVLLWLPLWLALLHTAGAVALALSLALAAWRWRCLAPASTTSCQSSRQKKEWVHV